MLANFKNLVFLILLCFLFYSCNDAGYEIEKENETDAPKTETRPEIKEEVEQPKTDIKQEVNKEKKTPVKQYTIQIGAFSNESNAKDFSKKAGKLLNLEVTYVFTEGLYKVSAGTFSTRNDAISNIGEILSSGFKDPFITEINK